MYEISACGRTPNPTPLTRATMPLSPPPPLRRAEPQPPSPAPFSLFSGVDMLATPRTPTRLLLASPSPATTPANFNPDDFFASPPAARARATPECKRRLFLDALAPSPAGSFLTFGQFDTPRAGGSGRKRGRQRFPADAFSIAPNASAAGSPGLFMSPGRLPPASILLASPGKSSTPAASAIPTSTAGAAAAAAAGPSGTNASSTLASSAALPVATSQPQASVPRQSRGEVQQTPAPLYQTPHNEVAGNAKQMFMTPITPVENVRPPTTTTKCSCKASKCLKLYCPCFAASALCAPTCSCKNCSNTDNCRSVIEEARQTVLLRDPKAFDPKVRSAASAEAGIHSKGCNCRKGCAKNYCVCRELNVSCGPRCTCSGPRGCMNGKDNTDEAMMPKSQQYVPVAPMPNSSREMRKVTDILGTRKRMPPASVDALRIDDELPIPGLSLEKDNMESQDAEFFKSLRAIGAPPNASLFPPATPERLKADVLALASSPATRSPRVRFARREPVSGAARPPRILRLKMGSGRGLRKFAIGNTTE